ncbi:DnaD domain-containing protein [Lysinibacillus fusiformis]|uniref:DnaD domain-containing protein n=1 Tax=Lysinibacillus fusiformis TaxID=28031 RepID=UPI000886C91A|nr:DnaD domain protein [Lysinibacillus fusiformis]SCX52187.1 DnaD and phage-associated domain-containing protein [Lysinibacillus fusiformis]SDB27613.1 DnaD and phage-associated domain-containing protein [Lysinibacillus fusiformis]SFI21592.1 DnaD and phage-associated domain-containing protein [Lysinibacillus fusiformis]SFS81844.1 DnaD and phage-associated domain-containing protein [Lysinibacillus fusiformis]
MAKYRNVHTTFWDDGFVLDLTPEEKYFYLYLMTNGNTTQCGIYELPYRVIEMHTGYNRETVQKLLQRFVEYGKITYNESTKEIMLNNWAKYNFINSPKVKKCIEKELFAVKHIPFVRSYVTSLEQYGYNIDTVSILLDEKNETKVPNTSNGEVSIPYQYPIDTPSIDYGEEEEQEEEQEREEEKEQEQKSGQSVSPQSDFARLVEFTNQNITPVLPTIAEHLGYILDDFKDVDLILAALQNAVLNNARNKIKYAEGTLINWRKDMITTYQQLQLKTKEAQRDERNSQGYDRHSNNEYDGLSL